MLTNRHHSNNIAPNTESFCCCCLRITYNYLAKVNPAFQSPYKIRCLYLMTKLRNAVYKYKADVNQNTTPHSLCNGHYQHYHISNNHF